MRMIQGYLVVLCEPEDYFTNLNPAYQGMARTPAYWLPPVPQDRADLQTEVEAMDYYVYDERFGDESGLIPTLENALILLKMFENSPRKFEIIFVRHTGSKEKLPSKENLEKIGYDISFRITPYWSILADFDENMKHWLELLNSYGIFDDYTDAESFLNEYIDKKLYDYDTDLVVWEVYRVLPNNEKLNSTYKGV